MNQLKRDIIAGHQSAIDTYTKCINDLMPMPRNELKDTLINQWLKEIKILNQELKEIKTHDC